MWDEGWGGTTDDYFFISHHALTANKHPQTMRELDKLAKLLKCNTWYPIHQN